MTEIQASSCDRRVFVQAGLGGIAWAATPAFLHLGAPAAGASGEDAGTSPRAVVRQETLFAGIRQPIAKREDLVPRIEVLEKACGNRIAGPLTHIMRFDTPVEGIDSELGFPVSRAVDADPVKTHTLRTMHFYARLHQGPASTLRDTTRQLYEYMDTTGLSPELELVEVFLGRDAEPPFGSRTDVMASFLAWPEVYLEQLLRVLGKDTAAGIWKSGEKMTPHTLVDPRCAWVARSIDRLKKHSTLDQQFDILSRVALVRPREDVQKYKTIYDTTGDVNAVLRAQEESLKKTRTGGFVDPPHYNGKILHLSKVPRDGEAWAAAKNHREKRKAFCFCNLVREAEDPKIDPIFCYRAAGWSRQFWEPILGRTFRRCTITHSVLKGDDFCAWDYHLD